MKKKIFTGLAILSGILVLGISGIAIAKKTETSDTSKNSISQTQGSNTVWTKIESPEKSYMACAEKTDFDLKEKSTEADYVFKGIVTECEEFEVKWEDENGEQWGPYPSSVITVEVNEEYYGESPVSGNSIRVYYPFGTSMEFDDGFNISDGNEYIFVTNALDEEFVEKRNAENPYDKFEQEKYADVYISDSGYDLMAVEDGKAIMHQDYFYWNDEIMEQTVSEEAVSEAAEDVLPSNELIENGTFIVLDEEILSKAIDEIFSNLEFLPDAEELKELHEKDFLEKDYMIQQEGAYNEEVK